MRHVYVHVYVFINSCKLITTIKLQKKNIVALFHESIFFTFSATFEQFFEKFRATFREITSNLWTALRQVDDGRC